MNAWPTLRFERNESNHAKTPKLNHSKERAMQQNAYVIADPW